MGADFYATSMGEHGGKRGKFAIDASILGMFAHIALKGKIEGSGLLRQAHGGAVSVIDGDIFAIKACCHTFHEVVIAVALGNLLELDAKFVDPLAVRLAQELIDPATMLMVAVGFDAIHDEPKLGARHHFFGGNVDFVPASASAEQLHVIGLIAILFGHINVVDGTAHFLLKMIGEHAVDAQADGLVGAHFVHFVKPLAVVDDTNHIAMVDVVKIASRLAHAGVDAVGQAVAHFGAYVQVFFCQ